MFHAFLTSWLLFARVSDRNQGVSPRLLHVTVALKLAVTLPEATFTGWPLPAPVPPENVM